MAEYLFVGGPWNGQRREVTCQPAPNYVGDYQRIILGGSEFYAHYSIGMHMVVAALLENYRPLTAWQRYAAQIPKESKAELIEKMRAAERRMEFGIPLAQDAIEDQADDPSIR